MKNPCEVIAVLLLGGSGTRFGSTTPKQYLEIDGMPLMAYPLLPLEKSELIDKILLVTSKEYEETALEVAKKYGITKIMGVAPSGESREGSVRNALIYLKDSGVEDETIVLIHDGDRPNLNGQIIEDNVKAASKSGAAVTAIPSKDSVILSSSGYSIDGYAKRSEVYRAQTPQTFRLGIILDAITKQGIDFTDDGSIVSANGERVEIVLGDERNIKITTPEDLTSFLAMKGEDPCLK